MNHQTHPCASTRAPILSHTPVITWERDVWRISVNHLTTPPSVRNLKQALRAATMAKIAVKAEIAALMLTVTISVRRQYRTVLNPTFYGRRKKHNRRCLGLDL